MKRLIMVLVLVCFVLSSSVNLYAKDLNIAFADKLKIVFEYNKAKKLNEELEKENEKAKKEFDIKAEEVKKLRDEMELLSEKARQKKEAQLEAKLKELDEFRRAKQTEVSQKYDEGIRVISEEINKACEQYGKNKKYDCILDVRASLYVQNSLDVTDDILKELNK